MLLGIRWGGLRAKIITWSFVPTAIILTAVALVGFYAYQQVTENLTVASSRELARLSAGELATGLTEYGDTLTALARTASIYSGEPEIRQAALAQASNRLTIFDGGVLILDYYGIVAATQPARPEIIGQDWSSRDYFGQMIRTPGIVYSNIVNDGPGGARVIDVAVPITNEQGEFVGTLVGMFRVGTTSVSSFYGSIVRLRIGGNGAAYLTDRTGWLIYHSNTDQVDENLIRQSVERQSLGDQASALRTRDSTGQEIVASFAAVPGTPWELIIEQSWDAMLASGQSYLQSLFLLLVLGLVTPALVVTLGVRRITEPINQLIAATHQVAGGNFGHKIDVRTGDELADLGEQFNRMSAQLAASYEGLKAREERFELVMQGTNDGIWDWDLKTDDVYFSPRWKSMLGFADSELSNRFETWRALLHPEDVDRVLVTLHDYLEKRSPVYQIEFRMRHKDGTYRWISARAGALWDAEGRAYRMTGSHTDITERKQSEEALRQSESRFAQVFHASPVAVSITALEDGRYLDLNDAWLRLFGYTREEVIGNTSLHLSIWLQPEQRASMIRQLQATGFVRDFEHLARTKSGEVRDLLVSAQVIELGDQRYNLSSVIDITERKRAEEQIRRQNEYLAALHETTLGVVNRLQVKDLLEAIVERAIHLVGAADGFVYLVTPDGSALETTVGTGTHRKYVGRRLDRGEGLSGRVWETGQPIAVEDYRNWPGRTQRFDATPIGPEVGAPLKSGSEVVGVIGLTRGITAPPFTADEIDLTSRFAQLASIALDNARLHTSMQLELAERVRAENALQERLALEKLITDISTQFINLGPDEIDAGIQRALQATAEFTGADRSYVFRFSTDGATMDNTHEWCAEGIESSIATLQAIPVDTLPYLTERITGLNVFHAPRVADLPPEARAEKEESERENTQSVICVPMAYRGVAVGFLGFDAVRAEKTWSDDAAMLLTLVGEVFVNALEQKRAQEELQLANQTLEKRVKERTREISTLLEIVQAASGSLELDKVLRQVANGLADAVGVRYCGIYLVDEERGLLVPTQGRADPVGLGPQFAEAYAARPLVLAEDAFTREVLESRRPAVCLDAQTDPRTNKETARALGLKSILAVPFVVKDKVVAVAMIITLDAPHTFGTEQIALAWGIVNAAAVAIENARLFESEQARREEAERRRQVAEGLRETLAVLNSTRSLEEILSKIAAQARRLLESDAIALFRLDQENQVLRVRASEGLGTDYGAHIIVPAGMGAVGRAVLERRPVFVSDSTPTLAELTTIPIDPNMRVSLEPIVNAFKTVVGIPLILQDEVYGAIALYYNAPREFSEEEIKLAVTFADQAALAIENARLRNQAERGAALAERSRLARDLHDSVTQSLYSVTLYAEAAARLIAAGDHIQAAGHLRELRDTAQEALREMRLLIFELRPPALEKTGLAVALQTRLDSVELRGGIKAELFVEGEERLSPRVQEELYHVAQEALNNALKHSNAQHVQVNLQFLESATCLEISDDGKGFLLEQIRDGGGLGFKGMRERAQRIGGNLQIDSAPDKGTRVRIQVPVTNIKSIGGVR